MRIDRVEIPAYKNLNSFEIDINEEKMKTVLLGKNASGKSNFFEALVIIFRDLDFADNPSFNYIIEYRCNQFKIKIIADINASIKRTFSVDGKKVTKKDFFERKNDYLPRYLFAYYSGISNRLEVHFDKHQKKFYEDLLDGKDEPVRPLFYAQLVHSNFVLMAFYSFEEKETKQFLKDYFGIIGLESVLFILKEPEWTYKGTDGDPRFWNARGTVKDFLSDLYNISLAPIKTQGKYRKDFLHTNEDEEHHYLYISSEENLKSLAKVYGDNVNFFKMLESTYMSDLIREVRIKVKKIGSDGNITYKELSEGEQQLLTVLGLLRFTKSQQSLILLDEPDTHLNPLWKWEYMQLLEDIVKRPDSTQILMSTHDPLVIGSLEKEEIRIFTKPDRLGKVVVIQPDISPKGLGVAGILTSDLFDLPSILDKKTLEALNRKRELEGKILNKNKLTQAEKLQFKNLEKELKSVSLTKTQRDPLYEKFIEATLKIPELQRPTPSPKDQEKQNKKMTEILRQILKSEKVK